MSDRQYFNLSIPAPKRLALMRADFAKHSTRYPHCPEHAKPTTWRSVRGWTHKTWQSAFATLSRGLNDGKPLWYSHTGPEFRNERDADDVIDLNHTGWFTDTDCSDKAVGIVARLTHGRFLAGYRWTSNDERVYFPEVFTDENDAARRADSHAEWFAEQAREDSERFDAMQDAENALQESVDSLRDTWALRRAGRRTTDDVIDAISELRKARETLRDATADYNKG